MIEIPWTHNPPYGVKLNKQHPLTKGLTHCLLFNEQGGNIVFNLAGRAHGYIQSEAGCLWNYTNREGLEFYDKNNYLLFESNILPAVSPAPCTVVYTLKPFSNTNTRHWIFTNSHNSSSPTFGITLERTTGITYKPGIFSGAYAYGNTFTLEVNVPKTHAVTYDTDNTCKYYYDGKGLGSNTLSPGGTSGTKAAIGTLTGGQEAFEINGAMINCYFFDRVLSDMEVAALTTDPYQIFEPLQIPIKSASQGGLLPIQFNQQRRVAHTNIRR